MIHSILNAYIKKLMAKQDSKFAKLIIPLAVVIGVGFSMMLIVWFNLPSAGLMSILVNVFTLPLLILELAWYL